MTILNHLPQVTNLNKINRIKYTQLYYSLKFASIISPGTIRNLSLLINSRQSSMQHNKILIKQSYLLLIWIMYLRGTYSESQDNQKVPSFFIHKKAQFKTTKLKTPMAHKTFSQEQFLLKFYFLRISFKSSCSTKTHPKSLNASIYTILKLRKSVPFFTTNLLLLKSFTVSFISSDAKFMMLK